MELSHGFKKAVLKSEDNTLRDQSSIKNLKQTIETHPVNSGGASFKTHVLIKESSSKLSYKPYFGAAIFSFIFFAIGFGVLFFGIYPLFENGFDIAKVEWFLIIFGLIFASAGGFMFYAFYKPRVFDKQLGVYYKAYNADVHRIKKDTSKTYIPLPSIVAIQLIGEHVKSDKGSYKSFELNLVLDDGSRKNVIDHGDLKSIIRDAEMLSAFLKVPIWHAGPINNL